MAAMWATLPSEVLSCILDKTDDGDLETFLAASAVCSHWRWSSKWVSSIPSKSRPGNCKKHHIDCSECLCYADCIRSILVRSKSVSKLKIHLGCYYRYNASYIAQSIVRDVLGRCSWLGTLQELHMKFSYVSYAVWCTRELLQVLRSCHSLSVLSLKLGSRTVYVPQDLILTNLKRLSITGYILDEEIQALMERLPNLEYLNLRCDRFGTLVINAPASVVRMKLDSENLVVNAAGVKDMIVQARRVELEAPLLQEVTLPLGTQIIKGSPAVRRLNMCYSRDIFYLECIAISLASCVSLSGIKTLRIIPDLQDCSYNRDSYIENSRAFFKAMSKLMELEELELNFDMVVQLSPNEHEVDDNGAVFLPKLKTLALDCSVCALYFNQNLAKRDDILLHMFEDAWEYLKSVTPHAQVVIRTAHHSRLANEVFTSS